MNTFDYVHMHVIDSTKAYILNNDYLLTTEGLAKKVSVSRTVVSRYLNQLLKENKVIKVSTRPVIYFDKKTLETEYNVSLENIEEFLSLEEMKSYLSKFKKKSIENRIIGINGSLSDAYLNVKSFFSILEHDNAVCSLVGEKGTGKKHIVKEYFETIKETNHAFHEYKLEIINCNSNNFEQVLFGTNNKPGLLNSDYNHILYISHADKISEILQQRIVQFLETENEIKSKRVGLIFATDFLNKDLYINSLSEMINIYVEIPSLGERPYSEIEKLAYSFFKSEENKIKEEIFISRNTFETISHAKYPNNIDGLIKTIQTTIYNAKSIQDHTSNRIDIHLFNLPEDILLQENVLTQVDERELKSLSDIKNNLLMNNVVFYYDRILEIYDAHSNDIERFKELMKETLNQYCDFLIFSKKDSNKRISAYMKIVDEIFDSLGERNKIIIYSNNSYVISSIIYKLTYLDDEIQTWESENKEKLNKILDLYSKQMANEYHVALEIVDRIYTALDVRLDTINIILLMMNMYCYGESAHVEKVAAIVIAHGYSTASSVADSVNRLIGSKLIYPIDMPLDVTVEEIIQRIKSFTSFYRIYEELILLVDMGSLENMVGKILENNNIRIGIINNVSTKVVLAVANGIINKESIENILESTCKEAQFNYKIYENTKIPAILFTNETGDAATVRVIDVFKKSLPNHTELALIKFDVSSLKNNEKLDAVLSRYNVLMITGTVDFNIGKIPFIAIDDLVACTEINKINYIFKPYLEKEEIQKFSSNLIKNFSLGNIMQSLTILNASVLIDYIEEATDNLQHSLQTEFNNKVKIRLYIHLSSLIERLVTKQKSLDFPDIHDFEIEHKKFISTFKKCFAKVCQYYGITIPTSEIAYLYEYLFTNEGEKYE